MESAVVEEQATSQREKVDRYERVLEQMPQVECPVQNHFGPGVYLRTMIVPAGVDAVGAVHKTEHLTIVVGHCLLTTDDGPQEFLGYHTFLSKPGAKRAIHAIETTVVTTVHVTEERDLDKLCALLTETTSDKLIGGANNRQALIARGELEVLA